MATIYKQTANMLGMDEYLSAYRTKPSDNEPSLQILLEDLGYDFRRDNNNNIIGMQKSPDVNLPKLTSVLDAYRHAAFSAIESNKRGSTMATLLGTGKEVKDALSFGKGIITGRNEISNIPKYMEASGTDFYNNKIGRKFSATKSDALKELNKVFVNQLKKMKEEGPNFKFRENVDFKFVDQSY